MNAHLARILADRAADKPQTPAPVKEREKKATVTPASPADTNPSPSEKEN